MTERENILKCYRHEIPDRLPSIMEGLHMVLPIGYLETPPFEKGGKDWFGVEWRQETPAAIPDPTAPRILTDIDKWREQVKFPDLENHDWEKAVKTDKVAEVDRVNKVYEVLIKEGPLERIHSLMGMQEAFEAMLIDEEEFIALVDAITDFKRRLIGKVHEHYAPDIINYHDDYGTQISMMMSPSLWRKIFKPSLKCVVNECHKYGILFDFHCCGFIEPIIPDCAEIGIDCLNCMPINDIPKMKEITKDRLVFFTNFNTQKYDIAARAGELDKDELRREIHETIEAYGKNGNYIPFAFPGPEWWEQVISEELDTARMTMYQ